MSLPFTDRELDVLADAFAAGDRQTADMMYHLADERREIELLHWQHRDPAW